MRTALALASTILILGCAAERPRSRSERRPEPAADPVAADPLRRLKESILAEEDPILERVLLDLLAADTDGRCEAYLEAGRQAWLGEKRELALELWRGALECGPRREHRIAIDDGQVASVFRLFPGAGAAEEPVEPGALDTFHDALLAEAGLGAPSAQLHRGGWTLRVGTPGDAQLLDSFRVGLALANADRLIAVRTRWVGAAESAIPPDLRPLFDAEHTESPDPGELAALLSLAGSSIGGPRVSAFPFQLWHVSVVSQIAYLADYELRRTNATWVADPVVDVVEEGMTVEGVAAAMAPEGMYCQIRARTSRLVQPLEPVEVELWDGGPDLQIEIPETFALEREVRAAVRPGETLWIPLGFLPPGEEGERVGCGLLLTLEAVPIEEGSAPEEEKPDPILGPSVVWAR